MKKPRQSLINYRDQSANENLQKLFEETVDLLPQYGERVWAKHQLLTQHISATARTLYLNDLYQKIVDVPGVICEFGVQWGGTLSQLINLRSIYEPFNHSRTIYGFDTFEGFPSVHEKDGNNYKIGDLSTLDNYENRLNEILSLMESFVPLPHLEKFELIKGDASVTIDKWLTENPNTIISLAILDMDLYQPTKDVLEQIMPRLTKGSVVAFDELTCNEFPGEAIAVNEVLGFNNLKLRRSKLHPQCSWFVYGE